MAPKHVQRIPLLDNHLSLCKCNKIFFKVFGAISIDSYRYIYECFGIDNADQFIRKHQDKFINKFCASDNLLCRAIYGRQWLT